MLQMLVITIFSFISLLSAYTYKDTLFPAQMKRLTWHAVCDELLGNLLG